MLFLIAAILSSASVAIFMRLSRAKNDMIMFTGNYAVCTILSLLYMKNGLPKESGLGTACILGVICGILFLGCFILYRLTIQKCGVVMAATFMKLGVLVSVLLAVVFFHELPGVVQILGIGCAAAAIVVLNAGTGEGISSLAWLLLLTLVSGAADSMAAVFHQFDIAPWQEIYLLCTFSTAGILCIVIAAGKKQKPVLTDLLWGGLIGIPNYYASRFLIGALKTVPAVIAYPISNVGTILIVSLFGVLLFRETLSRRKIGGLLLIVTALVLLNL